MLSPLTSYLLGLALGFVAGLLTVGLIAPRRMK